MNYKIPRCQATPWSEHQAVFTIDGRERLRWHFGPQYPRPFFFPFIGPLGDSLTRMGHPGAPNHDHHRSIWFAHHKVLGIDFWSDKTTARIEQKDWLSYTDGEKEAAMAVTLGWFDGHDPAPLLEQELVAAVRPLNDDELLLELQSTFRPLASTLEFQQTNFGFLAVRVAKSISGRFGGGVLTGSEGGQTEANLFGLPSRWMDYSGPTRPGDQGLTYFDHAANPHYPAKWHVREDGWMGASACRDGALVASKESPLVVRYLLHAHRGQVDSGRANALAEQFNQSPAFVVARAKSGHTTYEIRRHAAS